jgi:DnaJ-class molecular chaperone
MTFVQERVTCPACGGAGGGPMGRAGSAWDTEDYVCPRCEGEGMILFGDVPSQRPGIVKTTPAAAEAGEGTRKRKAAG